MIPIVCFVGPSGVGKTTLLERIVADLKSRGVRVAAIKHAAHGFEIDREGKDSWRLTQAGCDLVVVSSCRRTVVIQERSEEPSLRELASLLEGRADIVLAEGYRDSGEAKIEVFRSSACQDLCTEPDELLAVVSDRRMPVEVPQFGFDQVDSIVGLIIEHALVGGGLALTTASAVALPS